MSNQHDLLDDYNIQNKTYATLETEFRGYSFWLKFSAILLIIVGVLGICFMLALIDEGNLRYKSRALFIWGMFAAFIIALPMAYYHYKEAKAIQLFCLQETDSDFTNLVSQNTINWRLLAFALLFSCFAAAQFIGLETYSSYSYRYHGYNYEQVEDALDIPPVLPSEELLDREEETASEID